MSRLVLAAFSVLLCVFPALADGAYDRCMSNADGTNPSYARCGQAWVAREDARLNATWKAVFPTLSAVRQREVREEQRAWIKLKDRSCAAEARGEFGREGQVIQLYECRANILIERTRYLQGL